MNFIYEGTYECFKAANSLNKTNFSAAGPHQVTYWQRSGLV